MDTSSQDTRSLTTSRSPAWAIKHVALKTLVEGNAKLYYYDNGKLLLFFFSVNNSPIEQFEYKQYNIIDKNDHNTLKAAQNLNYINQLQTLVSCGDEPKVAIHKMKYNKEYLVNSFYTI